MRIQPRVFSARVAGHAAELDQLPAEMAENPAQDSVALRGREARQGEFQIALAHPAQASERPVDGEREHAAQPTRQHPRHPPQGARHSQNEPKLEFLPHR